MVAVATTEEEEEDDDAPRAGGRGPTFFADADDDSGCPYFRPTGEGRIAPDCGTPPVGTDSRQ
jgi:hypothetical protein